MIGARLSAHRPLLAPLRRLVAHASAADLRVLVVPGPDVALAAGLDLGAAGLRLADGPRSANVLLALGALPAKLADAAAIAYAQMPRPRAVAALGLADVADVSPLPAADARGALSQAGLEQAVAALRAAFASGAFAATIAEFDAPALQVRTEYTCPMHPEIVSDAPGSCPKCGMFLVARETSAGGAAPDSVASGPASEAPAHVPAATRAPHGTHDAHDTPRADTGPAVAPGRYTCPMHPEVIGDAPGDCPKCGMTLVPVEDGGGEHADHAHPGHDHGHGGHGHGGHGGRGHGGRGHGEPRPRGAPRVGWLERVEPGFMSMVEMTAGTPRSSDGLQMEWIDAPFGPLFPGLPGGLLLEVTLDGDTVVEARATSAVSAADPLRNGPLAAADYMAALGDAMPLAPVTYRLLACRAIEAAAGIAPDQPTRLGREAALARERIASHLVWLAQMGRQLGLAPIERRAAALALVLRRADKAAIRARAAEVNRLVGDIRATRFLFRRLAATGRLPQGARYPGLSGPEPSAAGRLSARLQQIGEALGRIDAAPGIVLPDPQGADAASGRGEACVETARGPASLELALEDGQVVSARLETPSARHLALVGPLTAQRELGDALVAVASLDLSPWEIGT